MVCEVISVLLEFKTKNYKSFLDEIVFSMVPAPKQTGLDYSIHSKKISSKTYKSLCSAVIYGPNASGKTNIIGAMDAMKAIVLRGTISNSEITTSPNYAANLLELIPNCNSKQATPTEFSIKFIEKNLLIEYSLKLDLGKFMELDFSRKILEESLKVDGKLVFSRGKKLEVNFPSKIKLLINNSIEISKKDLLTKIAESSLIPTDLFLNNGFKSIFSSKLVEIILNWLKELAEPKEHTVYVEKTMTDVAKEFGINSNAIGFNFKGKGKSNDDGEVYLCSIFKRSKYALTIPAEFFESFGTIRFINEFPLILNALHNGGTLVMDEFDASIHPMVLMNIVNIFHNDNINKNQAQLIFNTHNPIFLNASLFRRDEIKFVERDDKTNNSRHYSLSDFKTADGIRKGEDYMNNYFVNRYGAIKDIDFSNIIVKTLTKTNDQENFLLKEDKSHGK